MENGTRLGVLAFKLFLIALALPIFGILMLIPVVNIFVFAKVYHYL